MREFTDAEIARVFHETGRAVQAVLGDENPSQPWDAEQDWIRAGTVSGVFWARAGMTPREVHENWCRERERLGWSYGPVKDYELKTHPCLVPFGMLPPEQQLKNELLCAITMLMGRRDEP